MPQASREPSKWKIEVASGARNGLGFTIFGIAAFGIAVGTQILLLGRLVAAWLP